MTAWICATCAVQYPDTDEPPAECPVCRDERQYVGRGGQRWTTAAELATGHASDVRELEPGLIGVGVTPGFGIGQRALLVHTPHGNVLWDAVPMLDDDARARIAGAGGIAAVAISHPHFHAAYADIADAFDARVLLPRADERWIQRRSPRLELYDDEVEPVPGITVARMGGHFHGAAVLHWAEGAGGRGVLLTADTISVAADPAWVSFMWSYPNYIPLDPVTVTAIAERVARFRFDRIYGGWWGSVVDRDAAAAVQRSARRYVEHVTPHA